MTETKIWTPKCDVHQELMSEAYLRWHKDLGGESYKKFVRGLEPLQRAAVVIGSLNYQVENGGFGQWHDNGYSDAFSELLSVLREMEGECPLASAVREMVKRFQQDIAEAEELCQSDFEDGCVDDMDDDDEYDDGSWERYEEAQNDLLNGGSLSDDYYEISAPWLVQVEFYLARKTGYHLPEEELEKNKKALEFGKKEDLPESAKPAKPKKPVVKLTGTDGNALAVMGKVLQALRKARFPQEEIDRYQKEAMSGDYNNLLRVSCDFVDVR